MIGTGQIAKHVDKGSFKELFLELGWDNPKKGTVSHLDQETGMIFEATPIAQKRGVGVYLCSSLLDRATLRKIDRETAKQSIERLIITTDGSKQEWYLPVARKSGGTRYVSYDHVVEKNSQDLFQRLQGISFKLKEEQGLNVVDVLDRVHAQFNADKITSSFYDDYKMTLKGLISKIGGISSEEDRTWYASLLLNRLMFIYFIQRKGFLNNDFDYLESGLKRVEAQASSVKKYNYYKDFLTPLFHQALGSENAEYDDQVIGDIIGSVPYINGGVFSLHQLEKEYADIQIPNTVFREILSFFSDYRWHLDERPTGNPKEINPEILGHIFEKYVNQKQMGAYYTKEDVTGYMSEMAILPPLIDRLINSLQHSPWHLLQNHPNWYIPKGLQYACDKELPQHIEALDLSEVGVLDEDADLELGLPGECWRETLDRRSYVKELVKRLTKGEVVSTQDALTNNLDFEALTLDWIYELCEQGHTDAIWDLLSDLKIIDPTCGSGAFLFASLDLLQGFYDVVLSSAEKSKANNISDEKIEPIIRAAEKYKSRDYFITKTAILNNLYGLDLMPEAVEIARLRLFLALAARINEGDVLEPLPDLDMNLRVGNLIVGCSTPEDAEKRFSDNVLAHQEIIDIKEEARQTAGIFQKFIEAQKLQRSSDIIAKHKNEFQLMTQQLRERLDRLYYPYGKALNEYKEWHASHQPFHWFVEFPEVLRGGGFDTVIGNPPYVRKSSLTYAYGGFSTDDTPDIYAPCMERAATLLRQQGGYAMIVPISFQFSDDFKTARVRISELLPTRWVSAYERRPTGLFDGKIGVRSTIMIGQATTCSKDNTPFLATSTTRRWEEEYRTHLFDTTRYEPCNVEPESPWPRLGHPAIGDLFTKLKRTKSKIADTSKIGSFKVSYMKFSLYFLSVFLNEPPMWNLDGTQIKDRKVRKAKFGALTFKTEDERDLAHILLSGRLAYWWWMSTSDVLNVTQDVLEAFPISTNDVDSVQAELLALAQQLRNEQPRHPMVTTRKGRITSNYDMTRCREITDEADKLVLNTLGLTEHWPTVLLADAFSRKATKKSASISREWPFSWDPLNESTAGDKSTA